MIIKHTFNNSNNIVKFGFEYINPNASLMTIKEIINNTTESLIVYDSKNLIFNKLAYIGSYFINDNSKKFIGLVNIDMLQDISSLGIKSGFIRSTQTVNNLAIIISDKTRAYLALDEHNIFETNPDTVKELFDYVNHIIWSKSDFEVIQGSLPAPVRSLRLSVIKPNFEKILTFDRLKVVDFEFGTSDFKSNKLLLTTPKDTDKESLLIHSSLNSIAIDNEMYINLFENYYIPCKISDSIFNGKSFKDKKLSDLLNKNLWISGKDQSIKEERIIKETLYKPLDEYKTFNPDFNSYYTEAIDKYTCLVNIEIEILPLVIDKTYSISKRYSNIEKVTDTISSKIKDIRKLVSDEKVEKSFKKQLDKIENTRILVDKIKLYNKLIEDIKLGDDSLLNKKDKRYQPISINEKDILAPNDLIGKLYEKNNFLYLAIKNEDDVLLAKNWIDENKEKAILVLDNE